MNRNLALSIGVAAATLIVPPHAVDARGKQVRPQRARSGEAVRPAKTHQHLPRALRLKLKSSRPRFSWRRRSIRPLRRKGVAASPRARLAKRRFSRVKPRRSRCAAGAAKAARAPRRSVKGLRIVARVRPISRRAFRLRSSRALRRLRGAERRQAVTLLAASRVRSSSSARHTVLAYLRLRAVKGGSKLPISIADIKGMVGSRRWTSRRLSNFALVLHQARQIARTQRVSPKEAFNRALKQNGIYRKYHSGVCGA